MFDISDIATMESITPTAAPASTIRGSISYTLAV